ncbi:aldose 1-epimerase family protein [Anaerofilum sp. BX8]|uniref:Aldose 1-epimerase family protein n=1 Tax=Anaerofilum hominis TaxID=2763016 RepID=A0A923IE09_9FIRM|nr:aldose 1-epimerase family protein [Anaerofilum hominis]
MITISNEHLIVACDTLGGELQSIRDASTDLEYLWQGDRAYWGRRALNLFPLVGRLYEKTYTLHGTPYPMQIHGFLPHARMELATIAPDRCRFTLSDSTATWEVYPFSFCFSIEYWLSGCTLQIGFEVENRSPETLYCAMGGHPGFNLPLEEGLRFEDYEIRFPAPCLPQLVEFSPAVLCTGTRTAYPLQEGCRLPLRHSLFDQDAVVLAGTPRCAELSSPRGNHGIRVEYPQMPYVGFWHKPGVEAPFLCIEPWSALPGREGVVEELSLMADLTAVPAGGRFVNRWSITVW